MNNLTKMFYQVHEGGEKAGKESAGHGPIKRKYAAGSFIGQQYVSIVVVDREVRKEEQLKTWEKPQTQITWFISTGGQTRYKKGATGRESTAVLNKPCRRNWGRHYFQYCPNSLDALQSRPREDNRVTKKAKTEECGKYKWTLSAGKLSRITGVSYIAYNLNGALFEASFLKEKLAGRLMADQGADTNLILSWLLDDISMHSPKTLMTTLDLPHIYTRI